MFRKNKFLTLLIPLILIIGLLIALKLVQQNQNTQNKATSKVCSVGNLGTTCTKGDLTCQLYRFSDCSTVCNQNCKKTTNSTQNTNSTKKVTPTVKTCVAGNLNTTCYNKSGAKCTLYRSSDCKTSCIVNCSKVCTPDSTKCVGNQIYLCSHDGTLWMASTKCSSTNRVCYKGDCIFNVCTPSTYKCNNTSSTVLRCKSDGSGWEDHQYCPSGLTCSGSHCI